MEQHLQDLEPIREVTWQEVFEFWRENEGHNPDWIKVATDRGFASWEEWRRSYVKPAKLDERGWTLCRVTDPLATVPAFRGGPFKAWVEQIYGDAGPTPPFAEIAERLRGQKNGRVLSLLPSFPAQTTITGVRTERGIVVLEGMHRCSALAVMAMQGTPVNTDLRIALGSALPGDAELFSKIIGGHRKGEPPARG